LLAAFLRLLRRRYSSQSRGGSRRGFDSLEAVAFLCSFRARFNFFKSQLVGSFETVSVFVLAS
jgi:hypothetical protein